MHAHDSAAPGLDHTDSAAQAGTLDPRYPFPAQAVALHKPHTAFFCPKYKLIDGVVIAGLQPRLTFTQEDRPTWTFFAEPKHAKHSTG